MKPGRGQGSLAKEGRLYFNIVQFPPPDATADEADLPEPVGLKSQSAPDHAGFVTTVRKWRRRSTVSVTAGGGHFEHMLSIPTLCFRNNCSL